MVAPAAAFKRATLADLPSNSWTTIVVNDGTGANEVDIYVTACRAVNKTAATVTLDARVDPAAGDTVVVEDGAVIPAGYPLLIRDIALEPGDRLELRAGTADALDIYVAFVSTRKVI